MSPPSSALAPHESTMDVLHVSEPDGRLVPFGSPTGPTKLTSSTFGGLPLDIWNAVFTHMLPADLVTMAQLNSTFHAIVVTSQAWRFYRTLFPTSRKIWALSWQEAHDGYFARTIPPTGREPVMNFATAGLPQDKPFDEMFVHSNRRVIEFFGPSVRHRHDTFLTQSDEQSQTCRSWRITSTTQYSMGEVVSVTKVVLNLPPRGYHLRPAGLDIVGTFLFWVDYMDEPLSFSITDEGIQFEDDFWGNVLWPSGAFDETGEELCLLQKLFLRWGENQFDFSGQMVCATPSVQQPGRKQILRLYDYQKNRAHSVSFDEILGKEGPWLGKWKAPWILPWGFDDDGNLLFKILDTRIVNNVEVIRCVQTSFNLESMRTTFSVEILDDIQLLNPWNFQMFSDQCWGYPAKDGSGNVWCILRDLRNGNLVRRVGPLNRPGTKPEDYTCHISMFHVIFQDKSVRLKAKSKPAYSSLRVFSIKPVSPAIRHEYGIPDIDLPFSHSRLLYELEPPQHPDPPGFWVFGGEDAAERYLFFQGSPIKVDNALMYDDWKKWIVWDSYRREWSIVKCQRDPRALGFYCLYSEIDEDMDMDRVGLDWVRMEVRE